jgi:hypothetical protein
LANSPTSAQQAAPVPSAAPQATPTQPTGPLAFTGAHVLEGLLAGFVLVGLGGVMLWITRRRRGHSAA